MVDSFFQKTLWVLAALLCSCGAKQDEVTWHVLPFRIPTMEASTPVMYWAYQTPEGVSPLRPGLAGFEPVWGTSYRVVVRFSEAGGIFGDVAGMPSRSLVRFEPLDPRVTTEFEVPALGAPWLGPDRRSFVDGQSFSCTDTVCDSLDALVQNPEARFDARMRINTDGSLQLLEVRPGKEPATP